MDEKTGYLQLYQFGTGTAEEIDRYLAEFRAADIHKLIIDLRDNGGGYLDALAQVASRFLPGGTLCMKQVYPDGSEEDVYAASGFMQSYDGIVILINENTASASEVFTLAMKEQRDDVTVVGTKSYGKGTVQITRMFDDGSAIKYTTSKWVSPQGVWVNLNGIEPDETVEVPEGVSRVYVGMEEDESYQTDQVSEAVKDVQIAMDYLGYSVDRKDGYFSSSTSDALKKFAADNGLDYNGKLTKELHEAIVSALIMNWSTTHDHDTQLAKAREILNG
jgi:carboxyl-terminal processing protease